MKLLLILPLLYVAIEAHAYGGRPQPARPVASSYSARPSSPGTYSYVRPAARAPSPSRPAVKYVAPVKISPAASVVYPSSKSNSYSGSESVPSAAAAKSGNNGGFVYYTTESVFYTTAAYDNGYYAEHIYYSTEQPYYAATESSSYNNDYNNNNEAVYSYIDPTTYFGEAPAANYVANPAGASDYVANPAGGSDYAASPAGGNDYVGASPATDYRASPADYGTSPAGGNEYVDTGYFTEATPANYVEPAGNYYTVAPVVEQYAPENAVYYAETAPVYDGQPGYSAANIYSAGADVVNDYATAVPPPVYYPADQQAPNSPFVAPNAQYGS